ncbi:MFS family permease [Leucobacter exalbidus]|uniref:MFS family permease n=1 Tax=Leucobacter exalbidus TaxID=662960 RepID=A0A940T732_9MICO|nr:MFS transporter [Leucobacter exalbidus]MBP1327601.1 MFS family permease [Leucobacter exalbidus]
MSLDTATVALPASTDVEEDPAAPGAGSAAPSAVGAELGAAGTVRPATAARSGVWIGVWCVVFVCSWAGNQFSPLLLMYQEREHYSSVMVTAFLGVYVLGLAPALLIAGTLSDRYGRKPLMLAGVGAAVVGSALLALGEFGPVWLSVGRLFSGIAVGVAMAVGNSWVKELSQAPYDTKADGGSGARRAALAFTLGSAVGAVVAGLLAQWGPFPEELPFIVHIVVAVPLAIAVLRAPETRTRHDSTAGVWWRELGIPSARDRRFVRVVLLAAPWLFGAAAIGYGYLPTQLTGVTGSWGLVFATATTAVALGVSSAVQPFAKYLHSPHSARGLYTGVFLLVLGIAIAGVSIMQQSIWVGLVSNVVIGMGLGLSLVSGLLEVQRIASPNDLAGLTGVFYAVAYAGFLAPAVIAAIAVYVPVLWILGGIVVLGVFSGVLMVAISKRYLVQE